MSRKNSSRASAEAGDRDEAPALDKHFFTTGALKSGDVTLRPATDTMGRRGRPPLGKAPKVQQSLRLSLEVLDHFRSTGSGWQARIDEALRQIAELRNAIALGRELPARTPQERKMQEEMKRFNDFILGGKPTPADGVEARFAEAQERIARAMGEVLGISRPIAGDTPVSLTNAHSTSARIARVDRSPKARAIVQDRQTGRYLGTKRIKGKSDVGEADRKLR